MKKLRLNTEEKSVILEMHKKMGYKSMVSETMDLPDVDKNAEIGNIMSELYVSLQELNKIKSEGEDKLLDVLSWRWPIMIEVSLTWTRKYMDKT